MQLLKQSLDLASVTGFTVGVTSARTVRADRASSTQEAILKAAERLYAEHGVFAVSNRQVSEAAGQGNNAAVGYHFGTKTDLVRAIEHKHRGPIEELRERRIAEIGDSTDMRDWVAALVCPLTDHLAALGNPTWYARFAAQVMTDPAYHNMVVKDALSSAVAGTGARRDQRVSARSARRCPGRAKHHGPQPVDAHLRGPGATAGAGITRAADVVAGRGVRADRRDRRPLARPGHGAALT